MSHPVESRNPSTGELLETFTSASPRDVTDAVARARDAQGVWVALPPSERRATLERLGALLQDRGPAILDLLLTETGKRIPDGEAELFDVIDAIPYYLEQYESLTARAIEVNAEAFPDTKVAIDFEPYGVIGLIMPWNFPFYSPMMFVLTATIAGNAVVMKPSEFSTMTGVLMGDLMREAGCPEDLVVILPGADETGRALVESDVDKIFFVGSIETGKEIIGRAGVTPVQVELGGNSAAIVLDDADVDLAAAGIAWAGTYHSGQDCVGIKRVFVESGAADDFISRLSSVVSGLRPGVDYGPYITPDAMAEVKSRIESAIADGATLVCGGEVLGGEFAGGNWLSPSVLVYGDGRPDVVTTETFGNVLPVKVVVDETSAISEANDTNYGLSNSVFSRDEGHASRVASQLESGMVFINDPFIAFPGWDHWTGWKDSGFGTVESKLMQCLRKKVTSTSPGRARDFWYPYPDGTSS